MSRIKLGTIVLACLAVTAFVWASEPDELREKAQAIQREAAELAQQGHQQEAINLKRKALAMMEEAANLEHARLDHDHPEIAKLQYWIERIREEEALLVEKVEAENVEAEKQLDDLRRKAAAMEDKLRHLVAESEREKAAPREDIARRLEHLRIAVEHLNQAGLPDVAEQIARQAEAAERELHERHRREEGDVLHAILKQLDELRKDTALLRDAVNQLRK